MAQLSTRRDLTSLLELYAQSNDTQKAVSHNIEILKCIRGGLRMAEKHRLTFSPRNEYWRLPERRLAIAYFADRWTGRFAPASALRTVGLHIVQHFDQARTDGKVTYHGVEYEQVGGFKKLCSELADHARRLPPNSAWNSLREAWPKVEANVGDDIAGFLEQASATDDWEAGFKRRFPWFGYLDATSTDELRRRQAFFFGYANLWTTTNAYVTGGAQQFAPVIQNTPTDQMLNAALQWATGSSTMVSSFQVLGRDDEDNEPLDRSQLAPVIEVYGFLNLERAPFYNKLAEGYRNWFRISEDVDPYALTTSVGRITAASLKQNSDVIPQLAGLFQKVIREPLSTRVELETIESPKVERHTAHLQEKRLDAELLVALEAAAETECKKLTEPEAAMIALHLLLDSKLYLERERGVAKKDEKHDVPELELQISLPAGLKPYAERALAYLNAGLHVLFAGPPGTGKTTLAQFVGYAWDKGLKLLPDQMPVDAAPLTTVGNSAWSPFHTIGGLMPSQNGTFTCHAGIFIDPNSTSDSIWRLRRGALVLDEMNRADLDRCIGELYPLLSGSVRQVWPAGLPGVKSIQTSREFRVIATVNDTNLDDIVFPISEGLARRFQRIELPGGSRTDVHAYLGLDPIGQQLNERQGAAKDAVGDFFELVREMNLLSKAEDDDRLPFGVAYFALLRAWIQGSLQAFVAESTSREQARDLLAGSLRTLRRTRKWEETLRTFLSKTRV